MRIFLIAPLALTVLALKLGAHRPSIGLCSISVSPAPPIRPEYTYVLATALADTIETGPGNIRLTREPGHVGYARRGPIYGQQFAVRGIGGQLAHGSDSALLIRQPRIVAVIWDYDGGCEPSPWGLSARFVRPSEQVFLLLERRPRSQWAQGLPVFDNYFAGQLVYPRSTLTTAESSEASLEETLSPKELFDLTESLPPLCLWRQDPKAALRRLDATKARYPSLINRWPGDNSVRVNELYATEARRGERRAYIREACAA